MPELPEVEIVTRNLNAILRPPFQILDWQFFREDLRFPIPKKQLKKLIGKEIKNIFRRAKYVIFETESEMLITHLGMTGSWRVVEKNWQRRKHDHLAFQFNQNQYLVYEDARRFGFVEVCAAKDFRNRFAAVGVEPLATDFSVEQLTSVFKKLNAPIKNALMNQKFLVGVGNIYASEILFSSGVSPLKKCSIISKERYALIWKNTHDIVKRAIEGGGSTIENYKNGYGESGQFQNQHQVYGRADELCVICQTKIKSKVLAGRNTFWCTTCQR